MKESDIKPLLQFIWNSDMTDRPACRSCQAELHAYIDAELDGENATDLFPEIARHLADCQECRQAYEELKTLLLREQQGTLTQPPLPPTFDFSYLENVPKPSIWERVDLAGQQVMRLFTEIPVLIGPKMASFGPLPSPLKPVFVPVMASRDKTTDTEERAQILDMPSPEQDIPFRLKIGHVSEGKSTLSVQVKGPSSQLWRKARVTLRDKERRILESVRMGEKKEVTFDQIGPGNYLIEVKYQGQPWVLFLAFAPAEEQSPTPD